jgi:hypothetical protein
MRLRWKRRQVLPQHLYAQKKGAVVTVSVAKMSVGGEIMNLLKMFFNSPDIFDQECAYGNREPEHAVYCENPDSPYRKCRFGWYTAGEKPDRECPYFKKNEVKE